MGQGAERISVSPGGERGQHSSCAANIIHGSATQDRSRTTGKVGAGQGAASQEGSLEIKSNSKAHCFAACYETRCRSPAVGRITYPAAKRRHGKAQARQCRQGKVGEAESASADDTSLVTAP